MIPSEQVYDSHTEGLDRYHRGSTRLPGAKAATVTKKFPRLTRLFGNEWAPGLLCLFLDIVGWITTYGLTSYLRQEAFYTTAFQFVVVDLIQLAIVLQALYIIGGYDRRTDTRSLSYTTEHILALVVAGVLSFLLIYSVATFDHSMRPSRSVLAISFIVFTALSLGYRRLLSVFISTSSANRAFLVIGSGDLAVNFYHAYRNAPKQQRLEFVDIERTRVGEPIAGSGSPLIEGDITTKLTNLSDRYSGVILAERIDRIRPELLEQLVRTQFHRVRVYTLESFYEAHWRHVPVQSIDPFWPLQMGFQLARISPYHYSKRLFDLIFATLTLILCAPLISAIILLIWWRNGRPALFKQTRIGRGRCPFTILKFRTMSSGDDRTKEDIYTREDDPRITRVGRWLRKMRLDELPQLLNVWRGEMSLIGPRAEWTKCAERYERIIPFYHFRHLVKPGITGWAQVNYPYGESDEDAIEKLKYDLYYIRHYSLKLDAMIVLKTIYTMLFGKGR